MELGTILIIVIALGYFTKNEKGRKILDHTGNAAVHLAASADKASAALERQCDELLTDEEAKTKSAKVKEQLKAAKAAKAETTSDNSYEDFA